MTHTGYVRRISITGLLVAGLFVGGACTQEQKDTVMEAATRTSAAAAAPAEFKEAGHELAGKMDCDATSQDAELMRIECTGKTKVGENAKLTGTLLREQPDSLRLTGNVIGTVAGTKVFETDCLGC